MERPGRERLPGRWQIRKDTDMYPLSVYFVWKKPSEPGPFRVVRREVGARTLKGYPITFVLKSIPQAFDSWEHAYLTAERLNRQLQLGQTPDWSEEVLPEKD